MPGLTITPLVCFAVVKITFGKSNSSGLHLKADALANKCKNNTNLRPCVNSCLCVNFNLVACLLHVCEANCAQNRMQKCFNFVPYKEQIFTLLSSSNKAAFRYPVQIGCRAV